MTWAIVLIFIPGTIVSAVVANFSNFSTQVGVISYVLIIIDRRDISYTNLAFAVIALCISEDIIDGTVLGMNFIIFIVPIVIDKIAVNVSERNFFNDAFIFAFTVILATVLRSAVSNLFSIAMPNIMSMPEWLFHNSIPMLAIYILMYYLYSYLKNRFRLAI